MDHLYHWKHGWVPLDHHAALQKAKGNHAAALRMLADAGRDGGMHNRQHVAHAVLSMHEVPPAHRHEPIAEVVHAADRHAAHDVVPEGYRKRAGNREQLRRNAALAQHAQDLRAEQATGGYKTELNGYYGGKHSASTSATEQRVLKSSADLEASRQAAADREAARAYRLEQKRRKAQKLADEPPADWLDAWSAKSNPFAGNAF